MKLGKYAGFLLEKSVYLSILWDMYRYISLILGFLAFFMSTSASASTLPFTDIPPESPYYESVSSLYTNRIISDDGSGLFRPGDTIYRDTFVGLSVSVSCKQCLTPTIDDIVKYTTSPFIDLSKSNPSYYCIAYAADRQIVQGYTLNASGKGECQDGGIFESNPFCEKNKTTRIEAVAMLLRQANLWNDELNKNISKTREIRDISDYWYGYANKGIDAGILSLRANNTVSPDEYITRGEFANMAAKMLSYNQCIEAGGQNTLAGAIGIVDKNNTPMPQSVFGVDDIFKLIPLLSQAKEEYRYTWSAYDSVSGKTITGSDPELLGSTLGIGNWYVELSIIEKDTDTLMSSPTTTIIISDGKPLNNGKVPSGNGTIADSSNGINGNILPGIVLRGTPLSVDIEKDINFSTEAIGAGPLTYTWDFGDGTRITTSSTDGDGGGAETHSYSAPGIYTVTVTILDANGNTAQSTIIVEITGDIDSDKDGVSDLYDACPSIIGSLENKGCPIIDTNTFTKGTDLINKGGSIPSGISSNGNTLTINNDTRLSSDIRVIGADGNTLSKSIFGSGEYFSLVPIVGSPGDYAYIWKATDSITGKVVTSTSPELLSSLLGTGNWYVTLSTLDRDTQTPLSTAATTLTIGDGSTISGGGTGNGNAGSNTQTGIGGILYPSLTLEASSINVYAGGTVDFSTVSYGTGPLSYVWDFGDGTKLSPSPGSSTSILQSHTYTLPGIYTVKVTLTDSTGKMVASELQIRVTENASTIGSAIRIVGSDDKPISKTTFGISDTFSLIGTTAPGGSYEYSWSARDSISGKIVTGAGPKLAGSDLGIGNWSVLLTISDSVTKTVIGTPSIVITVSDGTSVDGVSAIAGTSSPSIFISANPLNAQVGGNINFTSISSGIGPLTYIWNFGDGSPPLSGGSPSHVYSDPGTYTVSVTVKDANGKTAISTLTIRIGDKDTDGDGVGDTLDICPDVSGQIENKGCPLVSSLLGNLEKNICILNKARSKGIMIANPVCEACPCDNKISFGALVRPCDVLFPTILSPDLSVVYSRGGFYQLP